MKVLQYTILAVLISLTLSACNPEVDQELVLASQNRYNGYPCFDYCDQFQFGYERAADREITNPEECPTDEKEVLIGCKAYAYEYKAETEADFYFE